MNILNYPLADKKWIKTETEKSHVVWHGSFSKTQYTNGKATEAIDRWNNIDEKYGTPYLVDRDGTVYNTFPDTEWIYHLNLPTTRGLYDKQSIGITLANEQHLVAENGKFYGFEYAHVSTLYSGKVHTQSWRGFKYFACLSEAQVDAAIELTLDICDRHKITPVFYATNEWDTKAWNKATIFTHAAVEKYGTDLILEPWVVNRIKAAGIPVVHS